MEKVAILTIATGKYIKLFPNFIENIKLKFLPNHNKTLFLFTDQHVDYDNVIKISHLPWPLCTLLRFYYFKQIETTLHQYDIIYYIDVDMIIHDIIDEEVIPENEEIIAAKHYWYDTSKGLYETNISSTAYVNSDDLIGKYCQGCFYGAKSISFINMINQLNSNVIEDLKKNVIAVWHDESHFNKYILEHPCKRLHTGYTHPESYNFTLNNNPIKILHKNANTAGF
jgi:hypothetical protein